MPDGINSIAENIKKRKEAQDAASGKPSGPIAGLKAAAPKKKPAPATTTPPTKPLSSTMSKEDEELMKWAQSKGKK